MRRFLVLAAVYIGCLSAVMAIWGVATASDSAEDKKDTIKFAIIGALVVTYVVGNIVDRRFFKKKQ